AVGCRGTVGVDELAARAPLEEGLGDPGLLLQLGVAGLRGPVTGHRVELPEHAAAAPLRHVLQGVQGQADQPPRHSTSLLTGAHSRAYGTRPRSLNEPVPRSQPVQWGDPRARREATVSGTTLDDYTDLYAQRVHGMKASEIRALFSVANRPEVVSLAGGSPFTAALPLAAI